MKPTKSRTPVRATPGGKIVSLRQLAGRRMKLATEGKIVVWTNGCFDLLHVGHIHSLQAARRLGDVLVVGINSDASVRRLKGPPRPIVPAAERAAILSALECVDYVVVFREDTPEKSIALLKPDIHCKGADYAPPHGKPIPEADLVHSYGGRICFLPITRKLSTTSLVQRIRHAR